MNKPLPKTIYTLGIFVLGLIVGGGAMYVLVPPTGTPADISRLKTFTEKLPTEGILYRSEQYGFSFRYPRGLVYKEFDEGGGAQIIVFQAPGDITTGFQIYITPYTEDTITGERILYDASGVISDLMEENIREDFLVATFFSEAPLLGKTREIWWLHNGYLFELTTYASLDEWIRDIVKTVEFD